MRKSIAAFLLAVFAAFTLPPELMAAITLPNLPVGSQYQLIFVTQGTHDALSSDIGVYNTFVTSQAAVNPLLPSTTWDAVAWTATVSPSINAPSSPGIPVYNTAGELVTSLGLYNSQIQNHIMNQFGDLSVSEVWTGASSLGLDPISGPFFGPLGSTNENPPRHLVGIGNQEIFGGIAWLQFPQEGFDGGMSLPLYALSGVITVPNPVPEPGTLTVWGSLILLVGGIHFLRWRHALR